MKVMILTGSNRKEATSTKLAEHAAHFINQQGEQVTLFNLHKRPLPFYSPDESYAEHEHLSALHQEMLTANAIILITPEYHGFHERRDEKCSRPSRPDALQRQSGIVC